MLRHIFNNRLPSSCLLSPGSLSCLPRSFHTSTALRCGLLSVLHHGPPFSPVSHYEYQQQCRGKEQQTKKAVLSGLQAIKHRGPDGTNVWMNESAAVALGHVRLAIIDLTPTGIQPLHNWKTNTHVAVNGELYNYKEWMSIARGEDWQFVSTCDSEIALYLYDKYGPSFMQHLRGEFALTLWDEERNVHTETEQQ